VAKKITLKTFRVDSNGVDLSKGLPERLKLLNWGKNRLNDGRDVIIDEVSEKVFSGNQRLLGRETVPIDYEHSTVPGTAAYEKSKPSDPVAGYGNPVVIRGEGLFMERVATTPHGLQNASSFKDISPAPLLDESNRVVAMHSLGLTVAGAVEGLTLSDAAQATFSAQFKLDALSTDPNAYKNGQTDYSGLKTMLDANFIRENDGSGETKGMSDEDTIAWAKAKWCGMCGKQGTITPNAMNQTPKWDDNWNAKIADAVNGAVTPLTAKITALTAELNTRKSTDEKARKDAIVAQAIKEGRPITLSAAQLETFSVAQLELTVSQIPAGRIPRGPKQATVVGTQTITTLTAAKPEDRVAILETNRMRTLDATISQMRQARGVAVNQ
jgi:hypothetical protein